MKTIRPIAQLAAALLLLLLAASGCAAAFVPTPRMKTLQASLDKTEAAKIFAKALSRSPAGSGLCKGSFQWDDPMPTANAEGYSLQAWRPGEEVGRYQENGRTVIRRRKDRYVEERRFAQLQKLRVTRDAAGMCEVAVPPGQAAITLHDGRVAVPIVLAVATGELDSVLAALTVLAPQAKLVEGAGL